MLDNLPWDALLPWIVLLPLSGAIMNGLAGRFADRTLVSAVGVGSVLGSFVIALMGFIHLVSLKDAGTGEAITADLWEWFTVSLPSFDGSFRPVPIQIRFVFDSLSGLMTLVVTGIGSLIHIYSLGYMSEEKSYARFFSYLNLFTASMLILVLASSFPVMFVGWEGVGLCSYLLIGFWYENSDYAAAGRKAFIANRIGDFGVLIGMFILVQVAGSFEFSAINSAAPELARPFGFGGFEIGMAATVACLFLFLGCTGKSAQIPLFVWLPDAMAGPTPVSALIHAATMVTAGVYLCCRLSPVFLESPMALSVIAIIGALTAFLAATIAVVQKEMKKILAYSTVSQLGFMFSAVGMGAFAAGFFHVFTHAFFKACLFLGAGAVMHAVHAHGDANIEKLGGLRKHLPIVHVTFLVSCLAIAGVPPFSGFFSKDEILLGAAEVALHEGAIAPWVGWVVLVLLFLAATMTAFYMFRLYFLTFTGTYRSAKKDAAHDAHEHDDAHGDDAHDDHAHGYDPHPHRPGFSMAMPLVVLAFGAFAVGLLGLPHWFFGLDLSEYGWWMHWMEPSIRNLAHAEDESHLAAIVAASAGLAAMAIGVGFAFVAFRDKESDTTTTKLPKKLYSFFWDKWRVDELYDATIIRPTKGLAVFAGRIDQSFVDTLLTKATSKGVALLGLLSTRIQVGRVHAYGTAMVVGLAVAAWWFVMPHAEVEFEASGTGVQLAAGRGLGYEYRWDLDGDGDFDQPLQPATLRIDLKDDVSERDIQALIAKLTVAVGPTVQLPQDRSALGHLVSRAHQIYEMTPPAEEIPDVRQALADVESMIESYEFTEVGEVFAGNATTANFSYMPEHYRGFVLLAGTLRGEQQEIHLDEHAMVLGEDVTGPRWEAVPEVGEGEEVPDVVPPSIRVDGDHVVVMPNSASVRFQGQVQTEEFSMNAGDTAFIGRVPVRIAPVVHTTLEVRNSFGNRDRETVEIVLGAAAPPTQEVARVEVGQ